MIRRFLSGSAFFLLPALLLAACHSSQVSQTSTSTIPPTDDDPRDTVPYLASDQLAGRAPGSPGLAAAGDFLAARFKAIGLQPAPGMKDYFQPFIMPMASSLGPGTNLMLNDQSLQLGADFSPLSITAQGPFRGNLVFVGYGITLDKPVYDDYAGIDVKGKVVLAMREEPRDAQGRSRFAPTGRQWSSEATYAAKAKNAAKHGAVALLLVTPVSAGGTDQVMPFFGDAAAPTSPIPGIQISRRVAELMLSVSTEPDLKTLQLSINANLQPKSFPLHQAELSGDVTLHPSSTDVRNVIACLPGNGPHANEFIVVGAHYDHLGTGQLGHMLGPNGAIYHGADDNASGTAAVLELAEQLKQSDPLPRSVIFVFFTAEEEGLFGSDWFVKHPPVPLANIVAMLNLDMVGRLKDNTLLIGGWGTAPVFDSIVKQAIAGLPIKTQSYEKGGLGPSDHMSFALQQIPVLFLFTGLHADYHRPTDTADKINYVGIDEVATIGQRIISAMATMPRQVYDAGNDDKSSMAFAIGHGRARRALLGVQPVFDSVQSRSGIRISDIAPNTPAQSAGLRSGDVITQFNGRQMTNLQDFSDALSQANPGDHVKITILRDGKSVELNATLGEKKD